MPAEEELKIQAVSNYVKLIEAKEGSLITGKSIIHLAEQKGKLIADPANNVLKIAVINRYLQKSPVLGFIKGFGIKKGAIAGSISHDSHNIISIGSNDIDLRTAITKIIQMQGGLVVVEGDKIDYLELPVAGLMSDQDVFTVAKGYRNLLKRSKELGSQLSSAFMTMSFMALLVIPELKIGDKGLFDVDKFQITSLYT
jgi:adenine deaminase